MGYTRPVSSGQGAARTAGIRRVLIVVLVLNVAVALAKLAWGLATNSVAMQADGFHSLFDGMSNIVGLVGMAFSVRPADRDHPYGHAKYETYASAAIAAMLALAAYRVGSSAIAQLTGNAPPPTVSTLSFVIMLGTLGVNLFVTTWEARMARRFNSEVLAADASHTRSDVLVSLGVIASLGLVQLGFTRADGIVALLVAGAIAWTAVGVMKQASATLSDSARLDPAAVCEVVLGVPGVLGCHHIRTRGPSSAVLVDLHVQVDEVRTVADGHRIAELVESTIADRFPEVADVIAHLEPFDEYQAKKTAEESGDTRA